MIGPIETFQIEVRDHLATLEQALLDLENDHRNFELINLAFRAFHTIKGGAGMFGFTELTEFSHEVESLLDRVRNQELEITEELIGVLLDIGDFISTTLDDVRFSREQKTQAKIFLTRLNLLDHSSVQIESNFDSSVSNIQNNGAKGSNADKGVYRINFAPDRNSFRSGLDVTPILKELNQIGLCFVSTHTKNLPVFSEFDPESTYLSFECLLITEADKQAIDDVFMFVADDWQVLIDEVDMEDADPESDRIGELLVKRGLISSTQLNTTLQQKAPLGEILAKHGLVTEEEIQSALVEQDIMRSIKPSDSNSDPNKATIRVPASKLDSLMNLVGELVIVQARLNQFAINSDNEQILLISEELDLLTNQMRDETFSIRLVPIGTTFGRFRRLVRDLSVELGKKIILDTEGGETELDKMVIDKLSDPLVHIIRNSIDHGIEPPDERLNIGKNSQGKILLKAEHAESHVVITIKDDGRGLSSEKIREKAIAKGIISAIDELNEEQLHALIFEPGFSTAEKVSDISGRGVGMDVVKRSIQELGGRISLKSNFGSGTQLRITLPMTLAIIEGLLVAVGNEHFVLPLNSVEECLEKPQGMKVSTTQIIQVRGEQIPFISLRNHFSVKGEQPTIEQVVVLHSENERFGFCVDEVVGQYQTVIKRLGRFYEGVVGFSGATIMGDGNVAIVLDPQAIIESTII
jgi:two-component system, chemotaxis family, sensor kinase CheA